MADIINVEEQFDSFLTNKKNNILEKDADNLCVRWSRKKYKCLIIYMLLILTIIQVLVIIFEKLDENMINKLASLLLSTKKNSTFYERPTIP